MTTAPRVCRRNGIIGSRVIYFLPLRIIQMLYAFIERLDVLNRALILLYLEDRSYAEIADILGSSETNVATRISRIKQKLRRQMTVDTVTATGA